MIYWSTDSLASSDFLLFLTPDTLCLSTLSSSPSQSPSYSSPSSHSDYQSSSPIHSDSINSSFTTSSLVFESFPTSISPSFCLPFLITSFIWFSIPNDSSLILLILALFSSHCLIVFIEYTLFLSFTSLMLPFKSVVIPSQQLWVFMNLSIRAQVVVSGFSFKSTVRMATLIPLAKSTMMESLLSIMFTCLSLEVAKAYWRSWRYLESQRISWFRFQWVTPASQHLSSEYTSIFPFTPRIPCSFSPPSPSPSL